MAIRDRILAAAEALFSERGFGPPSLRDLLSASGVSTTAFYARFDGKDDVLAELVDGLLLEIEAAAAEVVAQAPDVKTGHEQGLAALVGVITPRRGLVRVALTEGMAVPAVRERCSAATASLVAVLAAGFRGDEARAWALVGALWLQVTRWAAFGDLSDDELLPALDTVTAGAAPR